jgi:hypothetical protein
MRLEVYIDNRVSTLVGIKEDMMSKRTWGKGDLKYDPIENVCWYIDSKRGITRCYGMPTYGLTRERIPRD